MGLPFRLGYQESAVPIDNPLAICRLGGEKCGMWEFVGTNVGGYGIYVFDYGALPQTPGFSKA